MQDRRMISELSSKLAGTKLFQFVGLSHDAKELELNISNFIRADIVIIENCFKKAELHDIIRIINAQAASIIASRRLFKAIVYRRGEKVPDEFQTKEIGVDLTFGITLSQTQLSHLINMKIYSNTCYVLDKWIRQIIVDGIDIDNFNEDLTNILHEIGIAASLLGYTFLKRAIEMSFLNIDCITLGITKVVYPTIALMYKTTSSKVERSMRHAIETGWTKSNVDIVEKIFSYSYSISRGHPTNGEFVANIADYLMVKYRIERKKFLAEHANQINKINALIDISTNGDLANDQLFVKLAMEDDDDDDKVPA